jgi:hypothetical protein
MLKNKKKFARALAAANDISQKKKNAAQCMSSAGESVSVSLSIDAKTMRMRWSAISAAAAALCAPQ